MGIDRREAEAIKQTLHSVKITFAAAIDGLTAQIDGAVAIGEARNTKPGGGTNGNDKERSKRPEKPNRGVQNKSKRRR